MISAPLLAEICCSLESCLLTTALHYILLRMLVQLGSSDENLVYFVLLPTLYFHVAQPAVCLPIRSQNLGYSSFSVKDRTVYSFLSLLMQESRQFPAFQTSLESLTSNTELTGDNKLLCVLLTCTLMAGGDNKRAF